MGSTTEDQFVVGNLQADVVYVFEVSLGLTGPHSDTAHSRTKTGMSILVGTVIFQFVTSRQVFTEKAAKLWCGMKDVGGLALLLYSCPM